MIEWLYDLLKSDSIKMAFFVWRKKTNEQWFSQSEKRQVNLETNKNSMNMVWSLERSHQISRRRQQSVLHGQTLAL